MKKKYLYPTLILSLLVVGFVGWNIVASLLKTKDTFGQSQSLPVRYLGNNESTTTPITDNFITTTSSTSMTVYTARATSIDLNVQFIGSTTASQLDFQIAFSPDGKVFYGEDGKVVDSNTSVTHGAGTTTHHWLPGTIATSTRNITITPVASPYTRIIFGATGANAAVWANTVLLEPTLGN